MIRSPTYVARWPICISHAARRAPSSFLTDSFSGFLFTQYEFFFCVLTYLVSVVSRVFTFWKCIPYLACLFATHVVISMVVTLLMSMVGTGPSVTLFFFSASSSLIYPATVHSEDAQGGLSHHCDLCSYETEYPSHLKQHIKIHTDKPPFQCHLCPQTFILGCALDVHLRTHTDERPFKCLSCSQSFADTSALCEHDLSVATYVECCTVFSLDIETTASHSVSDCVQVMKYQRTQTFPFIGRMLYHELHAVYLSWNVLCYFLWNMEEPSELTSGLYRFCIIPHHWSIAAIFLVMQYLPYDGSPKSASTGLSTEETHLIKWLLCAPLSNLLCCFQLVDLTELFTAAPVFCCVSRTEPRRAWASSHPATASAEKPQGERRYRCNLCGYNTHNVAHLRRHIRVHTGERPYKCELCREGFKQRSALDVHLRTHTGERPYKCHLCSQSFSLNCSLKNHVRIHTGERPYECPLCPQTFRTRHCLTRHMRQHMRK
ncbi:hypothetical protein HPB51_004102 [Rhipicephalus microplus]|uniref:C2H2-type domain-containing protein n=1 Tax=Rhipicephalus microplus TaxID=6941 RepID=A0A9J6DYI3_RHIMP|nr:hypothetical protein HPB51_004102 [Rhipicephalus microplus]